MRLLLCFLLLISTCDRWSSSQSWAVSAFVLPSSSFIRSSSSSSSSTASSSSSLQMVSWEDVAYNAQTTANSLASGALSADSTALQSLPLLYLAGLLTSCSPCVWGLLPVTVSYISTAAAEREDASTTLPTLAFAAGLALVFCTGGVAAALLGTVFGATNDILAVLSAAICLAMGLQLLELVDLPLLSVKEVSKTFAAVSDTSDKDKNKDQPILLNASGQILNDKDENTPNGSLWRTFFLGGSSALVASPCATPVLTSILAYVATAQNAALGFALLLTYTLGYATPLLYIAATGGQALVDLKNSKGIYSQLGPWVTPITGGVLLGYGMNGLLTTLLGDPSLVALAPVFE